MATAGRVMPSDGAAQGMNVAAAHAGRGRNGWGCWALLRLTDSMEGERSSGPTTPSRLRSCCHSYPRFFRPPQPGARRSPPRRRRPDNPGRARRQGPGGRGAAATTRRSGVVTPTALGGAICEEGRKPGTRGTRRRIRRYAGRALPPSRRPAGALARVPARPHSRWEYWRPSPGQAEASVGEEPAAAVPAVTSRQQRKI